MSGDNVVLDSNIMIYLSQGKIPVDDLIRNGISYFISAITYMEVMGYKFESRSEEKAVSNLVDLFTIIYIDDKISRKVVEIRKKHKIRLPDAIICATAIEHKAILYTNDKKLKSVKGLDSEFIKVKGEGQSKV